MFNIKLTTKTRIAISSLSFLIYAIIFLVEFDNAGAASSALSVLPIMISAWFFGLRIGILVALFGVFFNVLLVYLVGENGLSIIFTSGIFGIGSLFIIGIAVGWLSDLLKKVRKQSAELTKAYDLLDQRATDLEVSNAELDAFAHTVAHDLKNPLTALVGYTQLLKTQYTQMSESDIDQYLTIIDQNGFRMRRIIDELLFLAQVRKIEDINIQPLDMVPIITEVQARLNHLITEKNAHVTLPASWPSALGYPAWIEEVWVNYVSNALKYGGHPPHIQLGATSQPNGTIRFWVKDNGAGIKEENLSNLFVPFNRLDQVQIEGHGLGLSIVHRIVTKLGGEVGADSQPNHGSTFWFELPSVS